MIEELDYHGVCQRVVVAVGYFSQNLLKLVDAVRRHDSGILIQKIRKPAQQTKEEGNGTAVSF